MIGCQSKNGDRNYYIKVNCAAMLLIARIVLNSNNNKLSCQYNNFEPPSDGIINYNSFKTILQFNEELYDIFSLYTLAIWWNLVDIS